MPIDVEKHKREMKEWAESDEGKTHFNKFWKKIDIKRGRYVKFSEWLKHNDFDKLMYRLILEHDEEYREKCWHKGCEVYPTNKLSFIVEYVTDTVKAVKVPALDNKFSNEIWLFKGYYFQMTFGQGTIISIYNQEDMRKLIQI